MSRYRVLVVSAGSGTAAWLADRLGGGCEVSDVRPGPDLVRTARERRPQLAVLDAIDTRPGTAPLEVALLKDASPGVQVVAVSGASTELDGDVIEQGVLCYLGGRSMEELLRVIERVAHNSTQPRSQS
jgi:hypothetical protein